MSDQIEYTEIIVGIRKIIRSINLESKQIQKQYGISIPQLLCLSFLNKKDEFQASSSEIKNYLNLNASTVSGIVSRLEKKGYVARLPKKNDKRVSNIIITSAGAEIIGEIPPLMHDKLSRKLKQLPSSKLNDIEEAISLLINFMGAQEIDASPVLMVNDPSENV